MAVEWIDAARYCPGVEREIICLTRIDRERIFLNRLRQHMAIFCNDVEEVPVQVHRGRHHRIGTDEADVDSLTMLDQDRLGIGATLAVNHIPAAGHSAYELGVLDIGLNGLLR